MSSNPAALTVPATVTLVAGQTSVNFLATLVNNSIITGTQNATVTASVENWTTGSAAVAVADDNNFITVSLPTGAWEGQTLAGGGTVTIGGTLSSALIVNLSSDNSSLSVPSTVTIPAGQISAKFNLVFQSDAIKNGDRIADVTASASGLTTGTSSLSIHDSTLDHLVIAPITGPQNATVPFAVTVSAYNIANELIAVYSGAGTLSAAGHTGNLPLIQHQSPSPPVSGQVTSRFPRSIRPRKSRRVPAEQPLPGNTFAVLGGSVVGFNFANLPATEVAGVPFTTTITAFDSEVPPNR